MDRSWYSDSIERFLDQAPDDVVGKLALRSEFDVTLAQREAWSRQVAVLRDALAGRTGWIHLEFSIPRMGSRADAVILLGPALFVVEFKVGVRVFQTTDIDQVVDYALDLHHFHETSHDEYIAPVLVATDTRPSDRRLQEALPPGRVFPASCTDGEGFTEAMVRILTLVERPTIEGDAWAKGRYRPTPTIIEATLALYRGHSVVDITRSEAGATNLSQTARTVGTLIERARAERRKVACFVTGVPGAGKTLVGLTAATEHLDPADDLYSVFLSGNGPLVRVLQEALARDRVRQVRQNGIKKRKGEARSEVKAFIQNVHHFRDDCLADPAPPIEHVAIFDEAQRAWDLEMTADFMRRKKGRDGFDQSEPEFLLSCLDRHPDWAVVICLVGGGQEINRGEGGIREWFDALSRSFPHWSIAVSDRLVDHEYDGGRAVERLRSDPRATFSPELHLATSIRSFRSEKVSRFVKELLDLEVDAARDVLGDVADRFPIVLTRDLDAARRWLRAHARGSERYGIVVSSQAERLKPHALDVRAPVDPVHWFLDGKDDVRSSYYLEDVATEFHIQGLELDWTCLVWDADLRYGADGWEHWSFKGSRWQRIRDEARRRYQKNAYRVLLTRARQGMVVVVPPGDPSDPTRLPAFYDPTFEYLRRSGLPLATPA